MIDRIKNFINSYNLCNKTIVIGFSGGYDSMCLLDILHKLKDECALTIIAAHYNHNWRGEKSKKEQETCREFCKLRNIEFYTETADITVKKTETVARELRYQFFDRTLRKYNADAVFTAHNYNDNAETLIYRIAKGTGIVGLNGILPKRDLYYRPLLQIKREDIEQYCRNNNLIPNIDESNSDDIHKRNLIRNKILPMLKEINPEILSALNNLSVIAQTENSIIDEYMNSINENLFDGDKIKTQVFLKQSEPVKLKIIYSLIYNSEIDYSLASIEGINNFIKATLKENKPSKCSLSKDCWLYVDKNIIEIITKSKKNTSKIPLKQIGNYEFINYIFSIQLLSEYVKQSSENSACVDLSGYNLSDLVIRTRLDGDIICPLGTKGKMKLKKYLMSKNIPQHERDNLLLLCKDNEVLWVGGVGISDKIKTKTKPTHLLKITKNEV